MSVLVVDPFPSLQVGLLARAISNKLNSRLIGVVTVPGFKHYLFNCDIKIALYYPEPYRSIHLKKILRDYKILFIIIYNDLREFSSIVTKLCQKLDIKILYVERGFIRGFTCQADFIGCNVRSSFAEKGVGGFTFDEEMKLDINNALNRYHANPRLYLRRLLVKFAFAIGVIRLEAYRLLFPKYRVKASGYGKSISLSKIIKRLYKSQTPRCFIYNPKNKINNKIICVILQLETDTQFIGNGIFATNNDLICEALNLADAFGISLSVKLHPNDTSEYTALSQLKPINFEQYRDVIDGYFGINSTALFEFRCAGKKSCSLLKCWYTKAFDVPQFNNVEECYKYIIGNSPPPESLEFDALLEEKYMTGSLPGDLFEFDSRLARIAANIVVNAFTQGTNAPGNS